MAKKTTVLLREDVYQAIKETAGPRNISNFISKILAEYFTNKKACSASPKAS